MVEAVVFLGSEKVMSSMEWCSISNRLGKDGIRSRCNVPDQLEPMQGKDSVLSIEAQGEAVWISVYVATRGGQKTSSTSTPVEYPFT